MDRSLNSPVRPTGWQTRYTVALMCMAATFDWNYTTQGWVLSSFYLGYLVMQIAGGRLADRFGGALVTGQLFDQAGNLVASLAQQALVRL